MQESCLQISIKRNFAMFPNAGLGSAMQMVLGLRT
nr:MAG TPA: hypothetical protein [Caudoviricetes sp.]